MPSLVPPVPILLDRPRQLHFTNEDMFDAELALSRFWQQKVSLVKLLLDIDALGVNDLALLLWHGLRRDDPSLTLAQVRQHLTWDKFGDLRTALYQAWNLFTAPAVASSEDSTDGPFVTPSPGNGTGSLPASSLASVTVTSGG